MIEIHADRLFTGDGWIEDVTIVGDEIIHELKSGFTANAISYPLVMPGFIDVGVVAEGYLEGPSATDCTFFPEEAFVALCRLFGVTSIVDIGSSFAVSHWLSRQASINALSAFVRLVDIPSRRSDIVVTTNAEANRLTSSGLIGHSHFTVTATDILDLQRITCPVIICRRFDRYDIPGFTVDFSETEWVCPQAFASSVWTVEEMLDAEDVSLGRAFLPYFRHLVGDRSFIARRFGKGILEKLYGFRDKAQLGGWPELCFKDWPSNHFLASSGAGATAVLPGRALWDELLIFEKHFGYEVALKSVTANPLAAMPSLNAGRLAPGLRMDLLLFRNHADSISELKKSIDAIVVAGRLSSIATERDVVFAKCVEADRRAI